MPAYSGINHSIKHAPHSWIYRQKFVIGQIRAGHIHPIRTAQRIRLHLQAPADVARRPGEVQVRAVEIPNQICRCRLNHADDTAAQIGCVPGQTGIQGGQGVGLESSIDRTGLEELERLDARQAAVIDLRYFGGRSLAEIATLLNISGTTVERDLRAAKAYLKLHLPRGH